MVEDPQSVEFLSLNCFLNNPVLAFVMYIFQPAPAVTVPRATQLLFFRKSDIGLMPEFPAASCIFDEGLVIEAQLWIAFPSE